MMAVPELLLLEHIALRQQLAASSIGHTPMQCYS